jgi:hypothetical protein
MAVAWKEYQKQAAAFFVSLGLNAQIEAIVQGAREKHEVDVYVTGKHYGLPLKWVVECKNWKTNIPKEKVMALQAIILDIGADKGILLSETGFQSGAIGACRSTNITLTSLEELQEVAKLTLDEEVLKDLLLQSARVKKGLWKLHKALEDKHGYYTPVSSEFGKIAILEMAVQDAIHNDFPVVYAMTDEHRLSAANVRELAEGAYPLIAVGEKFLQESKQQYEASGDVDGSRK